MGKLIYLDHYRPQEPDLPPNTLCGGLVAPYVVDPSVPPKTSPVILRGTSPQKMVPSSPARSKVSRLPVLNERGEQVIWSINDTFVKSRPVVIGCMTLFLREIEEGQNTEAVAPNSEELPRFELIRGIEEVLNRQSNDAQTDRSRKEAGAETQSAEPIAVGASAQSRNKQGGRENRKGRGDMQSKKSATSKLLFSRPQNPSTLRVDYQEKGNGVASLFALTRRRRERDKPALHAR